MSVGPPARFLGEGPVKMVYKRYLFVEDKNFGRIYVPLDAALPKYPDCSDLRHAFQLDEEVAFTAVRTSSHQGSNYVACSVVHKNDLVMVQGRLVEICEKYAYVDVPKIGRIFAPFSAKNDSGRPWHGKTAEVGRNIVMKILPQPEYQKCAHVAYAICDKITPAYAVPMDAKADRQPERVNDQFAIIVVMPSSTLDGLLYSQTTGSISFSKELITVKYDVGMFVYLNAEKGYSDVLKSIWRATHIEVVGDLSFVESDYLLNRFTNTVTDSCLTVTTYAIVCRVSESNSSAWLWNDLLGRIFVNNHHYLPNMHTLEVVQVKAQYTAAFEDVPWSAISVRFIHENQDELRAKFGQLLVSDDDWNVNHVCEQGNGGFYGFLEHKKHGAAFMAWTDLNQGERAPTKSSTVRVTGYIQVRDRKHPWRALLVTPLENGRPIFDHKMYRTTGEFHPEIKAAIESIRVKKPAPLRLPAAVMASKMGGSPQVRTPPTIPPSTVNVWNGAQKQNCYSSMSTDSGRASVNSVAPVNNENAAPAPTIQPSTMLPSLQGVQAPKTISQAPPPGFGSPANSVKACVSPIGSGRLGLNGFKNGSPPTISKDESSETHVKNPLNSLLFTQSNDLGLFGPWRDSGTKAWPTFVDTADSTPVNGFSDYSLTSSTEANLNSMSSASSTTTRNVFEDLLGYRTELASSNPIVPNRDFLDQPLDSSHSSQSTPPAPIAPPPPRTVNRESPLNEAVAHANALRFKSGTDLEYENFLFEQVMLRPHVLVRILGTTDAKLFSQALKDCVNGEIVRK